MKVKVVKEVEVNAKYLYCYLGDYMYLEDLNFMDMDVVNEVASMDDDLDAFLKRWPSLNAMRYNQDYKGICLKIDVDNGKVVNWPEDLHEVHFINVKIVDSGIYVLTEENGNKIVSKEGYVPDCLQIEENGYGDYLEFVVDKNGVIIDWSFNQKDLESLNEY